MGNIVITKEREHSWDITAFQNNKPVKKAWAFNRDMAIGKAEIMSTFYTDKNGQAGNIVINEKQSNKKEMEVIGP